MRVRALTLQRGQRHGHCRYDSCHGRHGNAVLLLRRSQAARIAPGLAAACVAFAFVLICPVSTCVQLTPCPLTASMHWRFAGTQPSICTAHRPGSSPSMLHTVVVALVLVAIATQTAADPPPVPPEELTRLTQALAPGLGPAPAAELAQGAAC